MKRYSDGGGNMGAPQKRFRGNPNDLEVRLLIPSKVAGSIIGKGGKNISRLRSDYKATVTVPDCPGPERILTVSASDVETVLKVTNEVVPNLEDFSSSGRGGKSSDDVDLRMLVHQSQAGCIIGKAGGKVKELREKTGARIKIYTNCCPDSTDRVVQITGKGNTCVNCIREIIDLLKTAPVKGVENPYDPHNFDDLYPDEYGGYGSAGGGMGGRGGGGGGGGGGMMGNGPPPMGGRGGGGDMGGMRGAGGGGPRGMGPDRFGGPPGPPGPGPRGIGGPPPLSRGGFGGGFGGGGNGIGPMGINDPPPLAPPPLGGPLGGGPRGLGGGPPPLTESSQVSIPKDLAGAIIGKSGARIRKIRADSGAGITIDEPAPGSNDRIITITGNPGQIQMAQYLLQQSVHENNIRNSGKGGRF
ncbi:hypothetical protein LSTR_LSTR008854 [Laodelphax striatellus]|uniref:K Homology domain-containing protein n=1 Tax=Laodelphax striatellus TaxID=195883 RepID=A0A482WSC1_LAOST|nr:hypothetical protein LSTR_LSTR008854 [Laodelphax striatellus]